MTCCLVTVNLNRFLTPRARDSFYNACDRWGCDYAEVHTYLAPNYPSCSKLGILEQFRGYDKILYLDADTVVSDHAPNPFEVCSDLDTLYAVCDYLAQNQCQEWIHGAYNVGIDPIKINHTSLVIPPYESFINAGMWMCRWNENVRDMFRFSVSLLPEQSPPMVEQGALNLAIHNFQKVNLHLLPQTWNYMIPAGCSPKGDMFINHFGGWAHDLLKSM